MDGETEGGVHGSGIRSRSPPLMPPPSMTMPPPPLPFVSAPLLLPGHRATGGAFTSYVRRRGEPDGHTACAPETATSTSTLSSSKVNPVVGRPGGGGESDAAFTPSPPVVQDVATLTLAHQTRIRTLYSGTGGGTVSPPTSDAHGGSYHHRPDSSSSASSATDWEGSGHNTVLRRAAQMPLPPLPPPRQAPAPPLPPAPMVDSLHPLPPSSLYNPNGFESHSSDSDFGSPVKSIYKTARSATVGYHSSSTLKLPINNSSTTSQPSMLDRLSVRTELSSLGGAGSRKPLTLSASEETSIASAAIKDSSSRIHYFTSDNSEVTETRSPPVSKSFEETPDVITSNSSTGNIASNVQSSGNNSIQDQIIATQLRRLNRELTPTISDVYHERNIGLGLAPPLSKLLLPSRVSQGNSSKDNQVHENESSSSEALLVAGLDKLGLLSDDSSSTNKPSEASKPLTAPWLSSSALQQFGGDLSTAELLSESKQRGGSPCSELSRRDEGDGRSIADSQCSAGSYNKMGPTRNSAHVYFSQDDPKSQQPRVVSFLEDVAAMKDDECKGRGANVARGNLSETVANAPLPRLRASKQPPPPIPNNRPNTSSLKFTNTFNHQQPPSQC